ncbi:hypothetical protein [Bradyrhizobium icense]|uniref:GcrA cell cycle regulator n=1 Tax=Bradyrhizobium icense TaxID=1274631 RepID=A0A1B1UH47_9BRAD|nr:hypothetical protein [Bradyrhizobium icense]ANW02075.1 hypothetical protein LMTR13_19780 [Bradyrhizobium icense]
MAKRWSDEDIRDLKKLALQYSAQTIAEKMDRTVAGVVFKAQQLGVSLKPRSRLTGSTASDLHRGASDV